MTASGPKRAMPGARIRFFEKLALLAMLALLSGCAATTAEHDSKISLDKADPNQHGMVFAAVGTQALNPFSAAWVQVRPKGQGGQNLRDDLAKRPHLYRAYFKYEGNTKGIINFLEGDEKGSILIAALPSGEYEFYGFFWTWGNFYARTGEYFSVPFQLRPGEALYLGRFIAKLTALIEEPGIFFDKKTPEKALFEVRDEFAIDGQLLIQSGFVPGGFKLKNANLPLCEKPRYVRCPKH